MNIKMASFGYDPESNKVYLEIDKPFEKKYPFFSLEEKFEMVSKEGVQKSKDLGAKVRALMLEDGLDPLDYMLDAGKLSLIFVLPFQDGLKNIEED